MSIAPSISTNFSFMCSDFYSWSIDLPSCSLSWSVEHRLAASGAQRWEPEGSLCWSAAIPAFFLDSSEPAEQCEASWLTILVVMQGTLATLPIGRRQILGEQEERAFASYSS